LFEEVFELNCRRHKRRKISIGTDTFVCQKKLIALAGQNVVVGEYIEMIIILCVSNIEMVFRVFDKKIGQTVVNLLEFKISHKRKRIIKKGYDEISVVTIAYGSNT